eukprot:12050960-Alexandrium_andersonii.AAC.1
MAAVRFARQYAAVLYGLLATGDGMAVAAGSCSCGCSLDWRRASGADVGAATPDRATRPALASGSATL